MTTEDWSLSDDQRADTVSRIKESMATMTFFSSHSDLNQCQLDAIATTIEKKAYTVAKVEAKTTTGTRPHHETLKVKSVDMIFVLFNDAWRLFWK